MTVKAEEKKEEAKPAPKAEEKSTPKRSTKVAAADYEGWEGWPRYRNTAFVHAIQTEEGGDYLAVGTRSEDQWVIPADDFAANYKPVTPNTA